MRAAAILGLGCSQKNLRPFQADKTVEWRMGMPASGDEADVILLFGGDGTIHRHLGQLVRLGLPVLIVPAGSGNDFARALGLRRVRDSVAAWEKFCAGLVNVRAIDLGVISRVEPADKAASDAAPGISRAGVASTDAQGRSAPHNLYYFGCVAGVGLDGEVSRRANGLPRWLRGHGGYVLSLAPTVFSFAPFPLRILEIADGSDPGGDASMRFDQPALLAAFANTPVFGDGMRIAPRAQMDDGLLDVCIVGGVGALKLFCMFPSVYFGRHLNIREVEYFHAGRVRVETEHPLDVYADGEFVCRTPVEVGVQRAAVRVVTP